MGELFIRVIGYRPDCDVARETRVVAKAAIALATLVVAATLVFVSHREKPPSRGNVVVLATLDEFTKRSAPDAGNTIPAFLASPGRAGRLTATGAALASDPVTNIDEDELRNAFCSPSIADLVRHEYPGYYDRWSDDKLERAVLDKHPAYARRYCMLSSRLDASANEVIKYEIKRRSALSWIGSWAAILLLTGAFAVGCLNGYYRILVSRL